MQDIGTPDYSRIITKTKRVYRPVQQNIPNYINLNTCKALICLQLMITDKTIINLDFIKSICSKDNVSDFLYYVIGLHYNIMFKDEVNVLRYLKTYLDNFGCKATELLVNFCYNENITSPQICISLNAIAICLLWSNSKNMLRILYKFGADISYIYFNGLFAEELHSYIPYYNHFSEIVKYQNNSYEYNHIWGYRLICDFQNIISEIKIICGDQDRPNNYKYPIKNSYLVPNDINYDEENVDYDYKLLTEQENDTINTLLNMQDNISSRRRTIEDRDDTSSTSSVEFDYNGNAII